MEEAQSLSETRHEHQLAKTVEENRESKTLKNQKKTEQIMINNKSPLFFHRILADLHSL